MNTLILKKALLFPAILLTFLFVCTTPVRAAFPIHATEKKQNEKVSLTKETSVSVTSIENKSHYIGEQKNKAKEDEGIYGILAFVFGILGIFPAAIVLGIIGTQKRRKLKGLAIAGLIFGLLPVVILLFALGIFIAVV